MERLAKKHHTARGKVPQPIVDDAADTKVAILAYGSSDMAVQEARATLSAQHGIETNYMRLRALPLSEAVPPFLNAYDTIYIVEQNRDAQLRSLMMIENNMSPQHLVPLLNFDGMPITAEYIAQHIRQHLKPATVTPIEQAKK